MDARLAMSPAAKTPLTELCPNSLTSTKPSSNMAQPSCFGRLLRWRTPDPQRLVAATEDGTVYGSKNGGRDFTVAFRPARS